jgi:tRNA pseudouridine55 synthase
VTVLDGCIVVDKPAGVTSHDVVAAARRALRQRRIGHAGTLDPDATGVLVLGVGRATRLLRYTGTLEKVYVGEIVLGTSTSTLDASGAVVATYDMGAVSLAAARAAAAQLTGEITQVPPMVSAVKIGGRRLHELARAGVEVERAARPVTVWAFDLEESAEPGVLRASVRCSSGTYVRVLADDLGRALGGGAHLRNLRRLAVGPFSAERAVPVAEISPDELQPAAELVAHLPRVVVPDERAGEVAHGAVLGAGALGDPQEERCAVFSGAGTLLAIYVRRDERRFKPEIVMVDPDAPAAARSGPVVTIGNFDGVHVGHRALLARARARATAVGARLVVVTFDRHPAAILHPESVPALLSSPADKERLLRDAGADEVLMLGFDEARAHQEADDFIADVLVHRLRAAAVVVGANFRFGRGATGDLAVLTRAGERLGFVVEGVELRDRDGQPVSSTRIRSLVAAGALEEAAALLGRPHAVRADPVGRATLAVAAGMVIPPPGRYHAETIVGANAAAQRVLIEVVDGQLRVVEGQVPAAPALVRFLAPLTAPAVPPSGLSAGR